jgi:DNA methylase
VLPLGHHDHVPGRARQPRRVFNPPQDQPAARSGHPYPLDWWSEGNGRAGRPRLLRYDNSLPLTLVLRAVTAFSDNGEHVVDPFLGGGTTAVACWRAGRRFTGGDLNPHALRFSAAGCSQTTPGRMIASRRCLPPGSPGLRGWALRSRARSSSSCSARRDGRPGPARAPGANGRLGIEWAVVIPRTALSVGGLRRRRRVKPRLRVGADGGRRCTSGPP